MQCIESLQLRYLIKVENINSPVYIETENFTLQKNNICSVTGNLTLKNCVIHIICHVLEGKFFCALRRGHFYTF